MCVFVLNCPVDVTFSHTDDPRTLKSSGQFIPIDWHLYHAQMWGNNLFLEERRNEHEIIYLTNDVYYFKHMYVFI